MKEAWLLSTINHRSLGDTELDVHPLCLGGSVFGWTIDRDTSFAVLDAYAAAGGNFVDTADQYTSWAPGNRGGESEVIIGEWLASRGCADRVVVATKVGNGYDGFPPGLSRSQVLEGCDASLQRLGLERIDLYYAHSDDPATPLDETVQAFDELVRAGKVRYVGASNYSAPRLQAALDASAASGVASFAALQPQLSLVERDAYGADVREVCAAAGLGVATYAALAGGFLTGKYRPGQPVPDSRRAGVVGTKYLTHERALGVLEAADRVAARHGVTTAQVALAWTLAQPGVTSTIASATSSEQLGELVGGVALRLAGDDVRELDDAYEQVPA